MASSPKMLPSRLRPPPKMAPNMARRATNMIPSATAAATELMRMSWLRTWESSWARTPRSSSGERAWRMPWVQHTAAWCSLRPVANALGWRSGEM